MKKLVLFSGLLFTTVLASAQTEVITGVTRGKDFGVTYILPKTQIDIEVIVNKVNFTPGEFGKYADRYLRLNTLSANPEEFWQLTSVKAKSVGVPNSEQVYFVKMKDKTVAPLIELTEDGVIKSINTPYNPNKLAPTVAVCPAKRRLNPRDFLTEEILMANSTAKMAELVAKEIYSIRESKNALVRGQADNMPQDGEQLKLMLQNLEEQETAMTEMFSGTKNIEEQVYNIRINPTEDISDCIAFRFSKKLGVVSKDNLAGEPIYITVKNLKTINVPEESGKKKVEGIAYNVPGKALVTLTEGKQKLFEGELPITQFGSVEFLAPALFNKKATTKVSFNPTTGGLIKVDREEEN